MVFGNKKSKKLLEEASPENNTPDLIVDNPNSVGMMGFTEDAKAPEAPVPQPTIAAAPAPVAPAELVARAPAPALAIPTPAPAPVAPAPAPAPAPVAPAPAPAPATKDIFLIKSTELIPETGEYVNVIISTKLLGEVGKTYPID